MDPKRKMAPAHTMISARYYTHLTEFLQKHYCSNSLWTLLLWNKVENDSRDNGSSASGVWYKGRKGVELPFLRTERQIYHGEELEHDLDKENVPIGFGAFNLPGGGGFSSILRRKQWLSLWIATPEEPVDGSRYGREQKHQEYAFGNGEPSLRLVQ